MYRERPSSIDGAFVWTRTATSECRVVPDGCMDLIWHGDGLIVAGPDTRAHLSSVPAGTTLTGLRFAPGAAPAFLGLPAHELRNLRVPLDALWSHDEVQRFVEQVNDAPRPGPALETAAARRLRVAEPPAALGAIVDGLGRGWGVTAVATAIGISERQLRRRSLDAFGYGPKTLARVLRMTRALALARAGVPFVDVALRTGYADQPHLARDVKELAGVPLGDLTR